MASLTMHLTEILMAQESMQNVAADDYLAAARLLLNRHDLEGAAKIFHIFQGQTGGSLSTLAKKQLSHLYKRTGRWQEAVQIWQEMAAEKPVGFSAISELAKYLEHRVHDYHQAKLLVEVALGEDNAFSEEEKESLLHRLKRLRARLDKDR
jgi:hypothetical protein